MSVTDRASERRSRLQAARLYLVCDPGQAPGGLAELLTAAAAGGVQVVQLRQKGSDGAALVSAAHEAQMLCERLDLLFIVNDHPDIALAVGADGVHVGQLDVPVEEARGLIGPEMLIGLSTHAPQEIDEASAVSADYIGVGPVHETPTKPGRPAVGLELVRYAAARSRLPFFAIGGINALNLHEVIRAGASRVAVVRAIAESHDPREAAHAMRQALDQQPVGAQP